MRLLGGTGGGSVLLQGWIVILMVKITDETSKRNATVIESFLERSSIRGIVDGDTIIICVQSLDEFCIEFLVENSHLRTRFWEGSVLGDDGFAEVQVDKTGRGELGGVVGESSGEGALVVVITVGGRGVFAADVDDGVAGGEKGGFPCAEEGRWIVSWEETEEVDC